MARKMIQIHGNDHGIIALCDDGTLWRYNYAGVVSKTKWAEIEGVPQPDLSKSEIKAAAWDKHKADEARAGEVAKENADAAAEAKALSEKIVGLVGAGHTQEEATDTAYKDDSRVRGDDKAFDDDVDRLVKEASAPKPRDAKSYEAENRGADDRKTADGIAVADKAARQRRAIAEAEATRRVNAEAEAAKEAAYAKAAQDVSSANAKAAAEVESAKEDADKKERGDGKPMPARVADPAPDPGVQANLKPWPDNPPVQANLMRYPAPTDPARR
jgi:hypothetical protein